MVDTHFNLLPDHVTGRPTWRDVWKEFVTIVDLAGFMFLAAILYFLMFPISLFFVGELGTIYLDAVGLGNTLFNVFGILVFNGVMTGVDTTMSQSYGTANKRMVGVYLQKGYIIYTLVIMVCIAVLVNAETLLVLLGQDREIARLAGVYVTLLSAGLPAFGLWNLTARFFRIQNIVWLGIVSLVINVTLSLALHYLFIREWGWGAEGSAIAQIIAYSSGALVIVVLVPCQTKVLERTWGGFTRQAWQDWGTFSTLSFTGLFIICLQWWGLEICTLLAGTLGEVELAAQAIVFQINYFIYIIPISVGISCNILIGQHVGGNRPEVGKLCMKLGWLLSWTLSALAIVVLLSLREEIPRIFSRDPVVIALTSETFPYLALYHVFDSTVSSSLGMCRGVARQKMGSTVSFVGIYCVGMPLAVYLTFYTEFGLRGLWLGPALGLCFESVTLLILLARTDWPKECEAAQIRAGLDPNKNSTAAPPFGDYYDENADDETMRLVAADSTKRYHRERLKRHGPELASSQTDLSVLRMGSPLPTGQLVFRRGLVVLLCAVVLGAGVVMHYTLSYDYPLVLLTNSTFFNGSVSTTPRMSFL